MTRPQTLRMGNGKDLAFAFSLSNSLLYFVFCVLCIAFFHSHIQIYVYIYVYITIEMLKHYWFLSYSGSDIKLVCKEAAMRVLRRVFDRLEEGEGDVKARFVVYEQGKGRRHCGTQTYILERRSLRGKEQLHLFGEKKSNSFETRVRYVGRRQWY